MKIPKAIKSLIGFNKQTVIPVSVSADDAHEKPVKFLRSLAWLSSLDDEVFNKVVAGFECRDFQEGAILLKEKEPDSGMFVIVEGRVRIEIRGKPMNEAGTGSLIGEMSVLTGYPRSASIVALTPLTVVWIESPTLKSIMKKSADLENGLWEFASKRFAMNLLGKREPYNQWEQNIFIQWLAAGEIKVPNEKGRINLKGKVGVLVTGTATHHDGSTKVESPASLTGSNYVSSEEARVFLRAK